MKEVFAEIITIGDEILYGQITDTNSQWISSELGKIGIKIIRKSSVGDSEEQILTILKEAESRAGIILITGGLGPTNDDLTKKALSKYFDSPLVLNEEALKDVTEYFRKRGKGLTPLNRTQAFLPAASIMIKNKLGTAPGMWFEKDQKVFISMPGIPFEMKEMMTEIIIPELKNEFPSGFLLHKTICTSGIGESYLSEIISDWEKELPSSLHLAYLPSPEGVRLRLTASGKNLEEIRSLAETETRKLIELIPEYIYGSDQETLSEAIGKILKKNNQTVSAAESCTGGYLSHLFTLIPGSSEYFKGSIIAYHNDVKIKELGVSEETLKKYGAVSEQAVQEMAEAICKKMETDFSLAVSGIAGPGGGSPEKPVGTVWIACSDGKNTNTKKLSLSGNRELNIQFSAIAALNLLRQRLVSKS
jgi:nicotinamide-nucleotide amidase